MPTEGKFVLGLEEPEYPPSIHKQEKPEVLNRILLKITLFILAIMAIVFILGLMFYQFPVSFIPAGIIALIVLNKKNAKRKARKQSTVIVKGIPQGLPRQSHPANRPRRNPSNLRQSGFRR